MKKRKGTKENGMTNTMIDACEGFAAPAEPGAKAIPGTASIDQKGRS
jgi:hypothetical protein